MRMVGLGVEGAAFMVVKHVNGDAAGRGASVHKEPGLVWVAQVTHMRLQIGEGRRVRVQLDPPTWLLFPWAFKLGGDLGQPIPRHLLAFAPYCQW